MFQAANSANSRVQQDAVVKSVPAPIGGLNMRDSLANMAPQDAIKLLNWFPRTTYCEIRGGETDFATGLDGLPKTLMSYNAPSGTNSLFASTASSIYDVSASGAVGAAVASCTLGKWQWVNFGAVSATHYLIMVNGQDKPFYYDGASWLAIDGLSTPALTGLTTTKIVSVNVFKNRLFFLEKSKLNFWYLAVQNVGGALTEFILDSLATRGGYTMAMGTWTIDAGNGSDDYAVFVTSEGEAVVFKGSDPSDVDAWSLVGVYFIGKPLGRHCFTKLGGDMVILVEGGAFPLSQALLSAAIDYKKALTDKINKGFTEASKLYGTVFGWEAIVYPRETALIVNIPVVEGGTHKQYVMNTTSKAWCEFDSWNAECFGLMSGQLYFGSGTSVKKAWVGQSGVGSTNIVAEAKTAFNYFQMKGVEKHFGQVRTLLMVNGSLNFNLGLNVNFEDNTYLATASYTVPTISLWDVGVWDTAVWQPDLQVSQDWRTPAVKPGYCASTVLKIATNSLMVQWAATDYTFETGGAL